MESRWGVKDSGVITGAITIKLRQSRQGAAMDGVIKIVQGCSGSTNVPHVPQQINAYCLLGRSLRVKMAIFVFSFGVWREAGQFFVLMTIPGREGEI